MLQFHPAFMTAGDAAERKLHSMELTNLFVFWKTQKEGFIPSAINH